MLTNILPASSFVAFSTHGVARPSILWRNNDLGLDLNWDQFAFFTPLSDDPPEASSAATCNFLGERYGGSGLGRHGGGVRCGVLGDIQVKGIGANCLADPDGGDYFHSYGGASVNEGLREAIWGEVCHIALPHGGVRVHGIIGTNTRVPLKYGQLETTPRALILREAALRPAHYLRAVFHVHSPKMMGYPSDAHRTREAINALGFGFRSVFGGDIEHETSAAHLNRCLYSMVQRFGEQIAAARAKRITHGCLTASNVCLDGRWIDYGRITTLSDYGRLIVARGMPDISQEPDRLVSTLRDLVFYAKRYLSHAVGQDIVPADQLIATYRQVLAERLRMEFLKLSGIPETILAELPLAILNAAYACFQTICKAGNSAPFVLVAREDDPNAFQMPSKMGRFHLNTILRCAATSTDRNDAENLLKEELHDRLLREEFVRTYWDLRDAGSAPVHSTRHGNVQLFIALNAIRVNSVFPELYHTVLNPSIGHQVRTGNCINDFIAPIIAKAKTLLPDPKNHAIDLSYWFRTNASASETGGIEFNGKPVVARQALEQIDDNVINAHQKQRIRAICNATS